jgi:hypothetical protein
LQLHLTKKLHIVGVGNEVMLLPIILSKMVLKKFMLLKRVQSFPQLWYGFLSNPLILKFSVDIPVLVKLKSYIQKRGQQVIDLEGLANHRGSAFGG